MYERTVQERNPIPLEGRKKIPISLSPLRCLLLAGDFSVNCNFHTSTRPRIPYNTRLRLLMSLCPGACVCVSVRVSARVFCLPFNIMETVIYSPLIVMRPRAASRTFFIYTSNEDFPFETARATEPTETYTSQISIAIPVIVFRR